MREGAPVVSITMVAPSPSVSFLTSWMMLKAAGDVSRPSVAPRVLAMSSLDLTRSMAIILAQPVKFAAYDLSTTSFSPAWLFTPLLTYHNRSQAYTTQPHHDHAILPRR